MVHPPAHPPTPMERRPPMEITPSNSKTGLGRVSKVHSVLLQGQPLKDSKTVPNLTTRVGKPQRSFWFPNKSLGRRANTSKIPIGSAPAPQTGTNTECFNGTCLKKEGPTGLRLGNSCCYGSCSSHFERTSTWNLSPSLPLH